MSIMDDYYTAINDYLFATERLVSLRAKGHLLAALALDPLVTALKQTPPDWANAVPSAAAFAELRSPGAELEFIRQGLLLALLPLLHELPRSVEQMEVALTDIQSPPGIALAAAAVAAKISREFVEECS